MMNKKKSNEVEKKEKDENSNAFCQKIIRNQLMEIGSGKRKF